MVVVCDFSPVPALHRAWAKGFEEIARRRGCILVKGVADELYTGSNDYQASDGIHLSARGQRAVAERIADALRPHLRGGG
jgi:lysophospholipase L1-like esterase